MTASVAYPLCGPDAPDDREYVACANAPVPEHVAARGVYACTGGAHKHGMAVICSCRCHEAVVGKHGVYAMHDHGGWTPCGEACPARRSGEPEAGR